MKPKNERNHILCLVTGEEGCGKSCLIDRYTNDVFKEEYTPTLRLNRKFKKLPNVNGKEGGIQLMDVDGKKQYEEHSINYYAHQDIVLVLYDVSNEASLSSLKRLVNLVRIQSGSNPIIAIVGCKTDKERSINVEEVKNVAEEMEACYFDTSAKTGENINEMLTFLIEKHLKSCEDLNENKNRSSDETAIADNDTSDASKTPAEKTSDESNSCSCSIS